MRLFFWLCLLLLIPGMLARIDAGGAGILAMDIVLLVFSVIWLAKKIIIDRSFPRNRWVGSGFLLVGILFATWLLGAGDLSTEGKLLSAAYLIRIVEFLIFGWAATDLFSREEKLLTKFFTISAVVILLGFVQFVLVPDISHFSTEGGLDPHIGRLLGTWLDPNYFAGFLGFLLPLVIGSWYRERKWWLLLLVAATMVALFLTFSRSGLLAAGVGLLFFFAWKDWKIILIAVLVAALGIAASPRAQKRIGELAGTARSIILRDTDEIDPTASLRLMNWKKSLTLWEKSPIVGTGYGTYRWAAAEEGIVDENYYSAGGADSTHLTTLVTSGVLGFLVYLFFLGKLWWQGWQPWRQQRNPVSLGFAAGLLALVVHACFVNSLFFPLLFVPVMAMAGVLENSRENR